MADNKEIYLRNIILGVSDGLVATVGLLSGINVSGTSRQIILLAGVIFAFVEGFSMAISSFLSEESVEEYEERGNVDRGKSISAAIIMFISFMLAVFIPIAPYLGTLDLSAAFWISIILSIATLFILGLVSARISQVKMMKRGVRMALLGGIAIAVGVIVGKFFKI